ncbi:MAG: C39 family peptidase [Proteobacteria bacterium]|nr:C39 family peptidase [Pseudomonadota bacterium]
MIKIEIEPQPTDVTCGPTSLHAVYKYFGDSITLKQVIEEVHYLETGGTLAVMLASHALKRGYSARIYTYNLGVFDPSWFTEKNVDLRLKLQQQLDAKNGHKLSAATTAYINFLEQGGEIFFKDLTPTLFKSFFEKGIPILTGLSSTYLYKCKREWSEGKYLVTYDDIKGYPAGHFVVLSGYDKSTKQVVVADPYEGNPISKSNFYSVDISRLINSIMLGIVTYDANLLIIEPKR